MSTSTDGAKYWTEDEITGALDCLKRGGLILVKGDIGYGLFGTSEAAIRKMYRLKARPYSNPCITVTNQTVLRDIALSPDQRAWEWIGRAAAWTTLAVVLPVNPRSRLLEPLPEWVRNQTVTSGTIAAFLNTGPYLEELIQRACEEGIVFVGSSANRSSEGNIYEFSKLPKAIVEGADFSVNHGKAAYANDRKLATTILNFSNWTIKRRGVNWERLERDFRALARELNREVPEYDPNAFRRAGSGGPGSDVRPASRG